MSMGRREHNDWEIEILLKTYIYIEFANFLKAIF